MKIQEKILKSKLPGKSRKTNVRYNKRSYQENPEIKRECQKRYNKKA